MVRFIILWSLHNRLLVIAAVLALIGVGIHSALALNVEAYPDPTPPLVEVITQNPGVQPRRRWSASSASRSRQRSTGCPAWKNLRSTSVAGLNDIKCQFAYGTDYWSARQEVINRIGFVAGLPQGVQPGLSPWSPTGEIVRYVLEGPNYTTNQLKAVQDWVMQRTLKTVPGVIDVTGYGGTVKQYQVQVDTRLLRQYNVTLKQVEDAIDNSNANVGGDIITLGSQAHNVRVLGLLGGGYRPARPSPDRSGRFRSWRRRSTTSTTSSSPRPTASRSSSSRWRRWSSSIAPGSGSSAGRLKEKDDNPSRSTRTT